MTNIKKKQKGTALILALFFMTITSAIIFDLAKDTLMLYKSSNRNIKKLQSYYSAQAALEMGLLKVKAFRQAKAKLDGVRTKYKGNLPQEAQARITQVEKYVDDFMLTPFKWPIAGLDGVAAVFKNELADINKKSLFSGVEYLSLITNLEEKININNLGSPSEGMREVTKQQFTRLLDRKIESNEELEELFEETSVAEIIGALQDWVDDDSEVSEGGGAESSDYNLSDSDEKLPPNKAFNTLAEIKRVKGMTDKIYELLLPHIQLFGQLGVNINKASKEILLSVDDTFTEDLVTEIITLRNDTENHGPWSATSFKDFLTDNSIDGEDIEKRIPFVFSSQPNFIVEGISGVGRSFEVNIKAYVYDYNYDLNQLSNALFLERTQYKGPPDLPDNSQTTPPEKGRPSIVHLEVL